MEEALDAMKLLAGVGCSLGLSTFYLPGREGGFTKGRDRTFHFGHLEKGIVGMISHLGAMLPVACGMALAAQLRGHGRVAAAFTGDGATSEGDFHEALNLAADERCGEETLFI